ncbi:uncharacterized protein LOC107643510 isoform X2 [Arachis ipaensis]|uniref:uncharacterized protein n=1 Tax=Arachis hypogaea TaxID=3818 RepID=UPI0007AF3725|nr:uncharacterized protein LOC107643510 isoform X2 [Arachis ipaensis]XP_025654386.1 uncharacterized protein LOC112750071 isoform X2 [Arachis hypogaea]
MASHIAVTAGASFAAAIRSAMEENTVGKKSFLCHCHWQSFWVSSMALLSLEPPQSYYCSVQLFLFSYRSSFSSCMLILMVVACNTKLLRCRWSYRYSILSLIRNYKNSQI